MAKKILVMGLPGSGKSTLANKLRQKLSSADHFEADRVRAEYEDWDFTEEGRLRQATRMGVLAHESPKQWAILDFICPKENYRQLVSADIVIWMDTIEEGRYDDTNKLFEEPYPTEYSFRFTKLDSDAQANKIVSQLESFDWRKPTVQMLGRWQPWHDGHFELFKKCVEKTGQVCIQIRDVEGTDDSNPFSFEEVKINIVRGLTEKGFTLGCEYVIMLVPNIVNITYGRKVGYTIEQEHFDKKIENISATSIRKKMIV